MTDFDLQRTRKLKKQIKKLLERGKKEISHQLKFPASPPAIT
jgi:hypothetical protein